MDGASYNLWKRQKNDKRCIEKLCFVNSIIFCASNRDFLGFVVLICEEAR